MIFPVKQVRIDTYYFCLMLVLVIPQIETSVVFVFILDFILFLALLGLFANNLGLCRSQEIEKDFGQYDGRVDLSWCWSGHF